MIRIYIVSIKSSKFNILSIFEEIKHIVIFRLLLLLILVVSEIHVRKIIDEALVIWLLVLLLLLMILLRRIKNFFTKDSNSWSIFRDEATNLLSIIVCIVTDFLRILVSNIGRLLCIIFGCILFDQIDAIWFGSIVHASLEGIWLNLLLLETWGYAERIIKACRWCLDLGVLSGLSTSGAFVEEIVYHVVLCRIIRLEIVLVKVWNGFLGLLLSIVGRLLLLLVRIVLLLGAEIKEIILILITLIVILLGAKRSEIHI